MQVNGYNKRIKEIAKTINHKDSFFKHISNKQKVKEYVEYLIENQEKATTKKSYSRFSKCDSVRYHSLVDMPDTIKGKFLVISIEKKLSNYTIINNELKEVPIYLIILKQVGDTIKTPFYLKLISETLPIIMGGEMKENVEYDLTLLPMFDKNCCLLKNGSLLIGHHFYYYLIYNDICIFKLNVASNYVRL
ncbi:MAG: hypothetical protein H6Q25_281 [Bacteroidetes bacterium]|nr:hypothetical protein [Bacteroidota bacterium]